MIVLRSDSVEMTEKPKLLTSFDRADELWTAPPEIARLSTKITLDKACPELSRRARNDIQGETLFNCQCVIFWDSPLKFTTFDLINCRVDSDTQFR